MYITTNKTRLRTLFKEKEIYPVKIIVKIVQYTMKDYINKEPEKIQKFIYMICIWNNFYYVKQLNNLSKYDWKINLFLYKTKPVKGFYFIYDIIFYNYFETKLSRNDIEILSDNNFSSLKNLNILSNNRLIGKNMSIYMKRYKNPFYILELYEKKIYNYIYIEKQLQKLYYFLLSYFMRPDSLYVSILTHRFEKNKKEQSRNFDKNGIIVF